MKRLALACLLLSPPVLAQQSPMPACLPSVSGVLHIAQGIYKVPSTVSTRADSWLAWVCSLPTGYVTEVVIGSASGEFSEVMQYLAGKLTYVQAQQLCLTGCWSMTASEQTFVNGLLSQYKVVATVSPSGTATARGVYNASLQPVVGATVAIGAPCNPALHIPAHPLPPPGTADPYPLYDVGGQPNASTGAVLPAGSYASCNVKLPSIGIGNL